MVIHILVISDCKISDFFSCGRLSILDDRDSKITHDIVVDLSTIAEEGGVLKLTENIIFGIIKKRPNWRLILLLSNFSNSSYQAISESKNIKLLKITTTRISALHSTIFHFINTVTFGLIREKIEQLIFRENLFIDNCCNMFWDPAAGWSNIYSSSIPLVCTIHDLAYKDMGQFLDEDKCKLQFECMDIAIKKSKSIITVSDFTKKRISEEFPEAADRVERIHIKTANRLNNDSGANDAETQSLLQKYNLRDKKYFIYISSLWPLKNHHKLLEAFVIFSKNLANAETKDIKLLIVGHKTKDIVSNVARELKIEDKVVTPGFVPKSDLKKLLSHAIAFIHPSLYEGFGIPIIEAMAAGVPIASSTAGSLPEVGGNAVLLFNPYDVNDIVSAMQKISNDKKYRESLIKSGSERVKYFEDNNSMIDDYIQVFEKVMSH
jgi:glycosyltransferase involved in cell wall biosynthesis